MENCMETFRITGLNLLCWYSFLIVRTSVQNKMILFDENKKGQYIESNRKTLSNSPSYGEQSLKQSNLFTMQKHLICHGVLTPIMRVVQALIQEPWVHKEKIMDLVRELQKSQKHSFHP